jgi:hypothetical protein
MDFLKVLSIDIGITNLGFVYSHVSFPDLSKTCKYKNKILNKNYTTNDNVTVIDCNRVDITKVNHSTVSFCKCTLRHERCVPDYLDHFIQEYSGYFNESDILLLERQPPVGITNVQDLLFTRFREKVLLISPNSVHKYFGLNSKYSARKIESEKIAAGYLTNFKSFTSNFRKHDISDALLMVLYYYKNRMDSHIESTEYLNEPVDFEQFRFTFFTNNELLKK